MSDITDSVRDWIVESPTRDVAEQLAKCADEIERLRALLRYAQGFIPASDKDMHRRIDTALSTTSPTDVGQ